MLALAGAPCRLAGADLEILQQMAASSPQHLAGRPAERQARIRAALTILDRLFPRPPICEVGISSTRPRSLVSASGRNTGRCGGTIDALVPGDRSERPAPSCSPPTREGMRPWV
jgi:hypothetical protein